MDDKEAVQMMNRCAEEIKTLRGRLSVVEPKADAYDRLAQVLDMMPQRSRCMGEDVLWVIEREREKVEARIRSIETSTAAAMARGEIE